MISKSFIYRLCQRIFNSPPIVNPAVDSANSYPCLSHPVGFCFGNTVKRDHSARPPIVGLSCFGFPLAITRLVIAIIVDSFNAMFQGWSVAHISNKVFKLAPSLADFYTSASIAIKRFIVRVCASCFHSRPRIIAIWLTKPMSGISLNKHVVMRAPTGFSMPVSNILTPNGDDIAAITPAFPHKPVVSISAILSKYSKAVKSLSSYVDDFAHGGIIA